MEKYEIDKPLIDFLSRGVNDQLLSHHFNDLGLCITLDGYQDIHTIIYPPYTLSNFKATFKNDYAGSLDDINSLDAEVLTFLEEYKIITKKAYGFD